MHFESPPPFAANRKSAIPHRPRDTGRAVSRLFAIDMRETRI